MYCALYLQNVNKKVFLCVTKHVHKSTGALVHCCKAIVVNYSFKTLNLFAFCCNVNRFWTFPLSKSSTTPHGYKDPSDGGAISQFVLKCQLTGIPLRRLARPCKASRSYFGCMLGIISFRIHFMLDDALNDPLISPRTSIHSCFLRMSQYHLQRNSSMS